MNKNWIFGLLIAVVSVSALVFIIKGNMNMAVLLMTAIFALSNGFRAISFKEKGFVREAKWMKGMSILFAVLFFVVLLLMFL
ncbi:hypothetical protein SAMN05518871_10549 [Psychrobacillus sp. OK028]|uniref:hypothetical protein n=1 Tax=Psychrobacillus sp. OK028 TaxID=1884359 RepID=UPI00087FD2F0|nr:hypothetical protein [Psychrobacillus sp. OK028]SDN39917.1 hypothetical protein SAMN05518871_10549 [Psychrobacillus sp. OK028]